MDDESGVLGSRFYPQFLYLWNGERVDLHGKILLDILASDEATCGLYRGPLGGAVPVASPSSVPSSDILVLSALGSTLPGVALC